MSGKAPSARPRPSTSSERVHPFVGHRGHQRRGGGGDYDVYDCTTCSFLPPISVSHRSINLVCSAEGAASAEHEEREREREERGPTRRAVCLYLCAISIPAKDAAAGRDAAGGRRTRTERHFIKRRRSKIGRRRRCLSAWSLARLRGLTREDVITEARLQ